MLWSMTAFEDRYVHYTDFHELVDSKSGLIEAFVLLPEFQSFRGRVCGACVEPLDLG